MLDRLPITTRADGRLGDLIDRVRRFSVRAGERAADCDADGSFPAQDFRELAEEGLLLAPFPSRLGGSGLASEADAAQACASILALMGWASLPVGRLYEGHINAVKLVIDYGSAAQAEALAQAANNGALLAVWNTERPDSRVRLENRDGHMRLVGAKAYASGAGFVTHPLITARTGEDATVMVVPQLTGRLDRADLSGWRAHGMRASATGTFDFTDIVVTERDIVGEAGDYHREPTFSSGAWRFLAVHLGGIERLLDELRLHLRTTGRDSDPHQLARVGAAAAHAETARLWVERAASWAASCGGGGDGDVRRLVAYVGLARGVVERAGLDVIELTQRSIGLQAFLRTHPAERISRDLATYLRQPAPDSVLTAAAAHVLTSTVAGSDLWRGCGS